MLQPRSAQFVRITPAKAQYYLEQAKFERQRSQREHKITQWATHMLGLTWLPITTVLLIYFEGCVYLVDGQHRLAAVIESGMTEIFVVAELDAENWQDVLDAYNYTDRGMVRTSVDAYRTLRLDEKLELNGAQLRSLGAAVVPIAYNFIMWESGWKTLPDARKVELILAYGAAARTYFEQADEIAPSGFGRRFYRAPVAALGVVTYRHSALELGRGKVSDFWYGVMSGANLGSDDPRKIAYDHLRDHGLSTSKHGKDAVSGAYQVRVLINCFNAFVGESANRNLARVTKNSLKQPVTIAGTTWQGKQSLA